jgi:hypothetical protein
MKPSTIYSKSGKGVQEASGKTSLLKRADRAVLSAIDGRATLGEVAQKVGKSFDGEFEKLIAQLDKEGFVREVAAAASAASQSRPAVATGKPAAKAQAAKSSASGGADDLDFTTIMPAIKPAARPLASAAAPSKAQVSDAAQRAKEQESALYKARQEAEAKAQAERDRIKQEAEAKARVEAEAKARLDAENRLREETIGRAKAAAEAQVKAVRAKAEAEVQAKLDAERRVREEVERKVREEAERALREAEALRQRLEEERKAREEVERKRREDEERRRNEEEERRAREEAERRAREETERKRREEEERKRREEEEKKRRAEEERRVEEEARRLREEIEAKAREAAELARREAEDRLLREKEEQVRRAKEAEEARMLQARAMEEARTRARQRERDQDDNRGRKSKGETRVAQPTLPAAAPAAPGDGSLDALMADLDSFSQREEEERRAREVADHESREEGKRKSQAEAERRAQEDAEREMREQLEREAREQEERQRRDEEERRAREEAERRAGVEERRRLEAEESRRLEAEERKRKAQEALLAKAAPLPDIEVSDKDLDMTEVRRDEAAVARDARKAQREREREARQRAKEAKEHAKAAAREASASGKSPRVRRKINWVRPTVVTLLTLLAAGLVALHVIPLPMDDYERAASDALGRPVKIGTGRLSLYSGLRLNLSDVSVDGSTTIAGAQAYPSLRALIEGRQVVDRLEIWGVTVPQSAIGAVVVAKLRGEGLRGARIFVKNLQLTGPVPLPVLEGEARIGADGAMSSVILSGPDALAATLTPTAGGEVEFDVTAANLTVPFAPELTLSSFAMKGKANRQGMNIASWGGGVLGGAISGTANLRWSGAWQLEGGLTARSINAAVFAPALLSEGKAEGQGRFSMSGKDPAKLSNAAFLEGSFSVGKGALGTVDLARVLHTSGRQYGGRTQFTEMTGHATYDHGAVALRNVNITAGALTAGANADIAPSGAIAGRIVADIRTTVQPLRAILVIGGTVKEPQVRN